MTALSWDELIAGLDPDLRENAFKVFRTWIARGDGVAVYENQAFDSCQFGRRNYVSYGSPAAMLEIDGWTIPLLPQRLPDFGGAANWGYQLVAFYRPEPAVAG